MQKLPDRIPIPIVDEKKQINGQVKNDILYALAIGCNNKQSCLFAGISETTLYKYLKTDSKFKKRMEEIKDNPILYASQIVFSSLKDRPDMALKVLEKLDKKYANKTNVEMNVQTFESRLEELARRQNTRIDDPGGVDKISDEEGG